MCFHGGKHSDCGFLCCEKEILRAGRTVSQKAPVGEVSTPDTVT
jgi:hypothetical protein